MSVSLTGYAAYLPRYRFGKRVVAAFDEDSTTMAVAAAAAAIDSSPTPANVYFATSSPAYSDKTNATAIHAALNLADDAMATDLCGTGRSAVAAWQLAAVTGGVAVAADIRVGLPGSADEKFGGDGAAALVFGPGPAIADVVGPTSLTREFLDRWRAPTSTTGQQWEERFGAQHYAELIRTAFDRVLDTNALDGVDHVVLSCPNSAIVKRSATLVEGRKSVVTSPIGFTGASDAFIALAGVLDVAEPGETILVLSAVDGCDAMLLRTTAELPRRRQHKPIDQQRTEAISVPHLTYLSWRGLVDLEPPPRPEPERPAAPPASRAAGWKFALVGTRCKYCGFTHLPPTRVCRSCGTTDQMDQTPAAHLQGTIVTYTVDRLAYSPSPPVVQVVVDVDSGGRCTLEIADAEPDRLRVGARIGFTFRRLFTADGVHDYFWKAHLLDDAGLENS